MMYNIHVNIVILIMIIYVNINSKVLHNDVDDNVFSNIINYYYSISFYLQ